MLTELDDYDWREAFGYAGEPDTNATDHGGASVSVAEGASCSAERFTRDDVLMILHKQDGEGDERPWLMLGRLKDGRWFYLEASCDYTGWDCQAGGFAVVAEDFDRLVQFGLGDNARTLWGLG